MGSVEFKIIDRKGKFNDKNPETKGLVSALMVTRGDLVLIKKSLKMFVNQTWPNKEICVVTANSQNKEQIKVLLEEAQVKYQLKIAHDNLSLGNLRNISMSIANGNHACTWDDDDLYARSRIEIMMKAVNQTKTVASFLTRVFLYCPETSNLAISHKMLWENSMLVKRSCAPIYRDLSGGEDSEFVKDLANHHVICTVDAPGQYAYIQTGHNTVGDAHFNDLFERSQRCFDTEETKTLLANIPCFKSV